VFATIVELSTHFPVTGGVWQLPRVRKGPRAKDDVAHLLQEGHDVAMPPMHVQERLVDLYFTYMHPSLPMIHKAQFLADWKDIRNGYVNVDFLPLSPPPPAFAPCSSRLSHTTTDASFQNEILIGTTRMAH
jgi:hypothetical protein